MADLTPVSAGRANEEHTLVADPDVLRTWRTGPRRFHLVAAVLPPDSEAAERAHRIATALAELLEPGTATLPHVTLWVTGFTSPPPIPDHEVTLRIGGTDTLAAAAYLTVTGDELGECRAELARRCPVEERTHPFVPHLTIGTYRRRIPLLDARAALAPWRDLPPVTVTAPVRALVLDTHADRLHDPAADTDPG